MEAQLCDQRWKLLATAQWHGFMMVFIVQECLFIILKALLNLSPPSSAHLESRFLGFTPAADRKRKWLSARGGSPYSSLAVM